MKWEIPEQDELGRFSQGGREHEGRPGTVREIFWVYRDHRMLRSYVMRRLVWVPKYGGEEVHIHEQDVAFRRVGNKLFWDWDEDVVREVKWYRPEAGDEPIEMVCVDNLGLENSFTKDVEYLGRAVDDGYYMVTDKRGCDVECARERFQVVPLFSYRQESPWEHFRSVLEGRHVGVERQLAIEVVE